MCGIIGIQKQSDHVFPELYDGLLMLQHRGQDAAGMVTFDKARFHEKKKAGLVKDVFMQGDTNELIGNIGLGHVRYPTAGTLSVKEAQPFFVNAPFGIYLVHNGNLTNTSYLRNKLQETYRRHLRTESDSEILLNVFSDQIYNVFKEDEKISKYDAVFEGAKKTIKKIEGAYAVITIIDKVGLFAFRDPFGIRPLVLGKRTTLKGDEYAFASEDVAFVPLGFKKVRDVKPGEAILVTHEGELITKQLVEGQVSPCIFEYIYLARPDSMLDNISVYKTQLRLGQKLAKQIKDANLEIDSIIPVPDSARPVALELSKETGIKYREGLVKNRYVGRTFIMPGQELREKSVKRKLNTIPLEFKNRNILLVDDSIVRGTTMRKIVDMCRAAGAKKIYVASAAPPIRYSNVYGIDMPTKKELLATGLTIDEIATSIGADKLFYQKVDDMIDAAHQGNTEITRFEDSCFTGDYVTNDISPEYLAELENKSPRSEDIPTARLINV